MLSETEQSLEAISDRLGLPCAWLKQVFESGNNYRVYPKKSSRKVRLIEAPRPRLKAIQRRLLDFVFSAIPSGDYCHGFCLGRSIFTHAATHTKRPVVITMDVKDFFPSVKSFMLEPVLAATFPDSKQISLVIELVTRSGRLPQGAPTSPHLANLVFNPIDEKIASGLPNGWRYSRYADDLALSGEGDAEAVINFVSGVIMKAGFRTRRDKTRIMGRNRRQIVTG